MSIQVTVPNQHTGQLIDMVRELKKQGLEQGRDFDFRFMPAVYDFANNHSEPRHAVFTFYEEKWATWFTLKWL
jgi:hypothetical protein